jgi:hypothetical protein
LRDLEISEVAKLPRRLGLVGKNIMMPVGYNLKLEAWLSDIAFNCKVLRKWLRKWDVALVTLLVSYAPVEEK